MSREYTTVEAIKAYPQVGAGANDTLLQSLIDAAVGTFESRTGRAFGVKDNDYATETEYKDFSSDEGEVWLAHTDIHDVSGIELYGETVPSGDYQIDGRVGRLIFSYAYRVRTGNMKISYRYGREDVPGDVKYAIEQLVVGSYRALAGTSVSSDGKGEISREKVNQWERQYETSSEAAAKATETAQASGLPSFENVVTQYRVRRVA